MVAKSANQISEQKEIICFQSNENGAGISSDSLWIIRKS